jgi:hypothetical protein
MRTAVLAASCVAAALSLSSYERLGFFGNDGLRATASRTFLYRSPGA